MNSLLPDVLHLIADQIQSYDRDYRDSKSLRSFSSVCKLWREIGRPKFWHRIKIDRSGRMDYFLQVLKNEQEVQSWIKSIHLEVSALNGGRCGRGPAHTLIEKQELESLIPLLPCLVSFTISKLHFIPFDSCDASTLLLFPFLKSISYQSTTYLDNHLLLLRAMISSSPQLESLRLEIEASAFIPKPFLNCPPLSSLHLLQGRTELAQLSTLFSPSALSILTNLTIHVRSDRISNDLFKIVSMAGSTLKSLELCNPFKTFNYVHNSLSSSFRNLPVLETFKFHIYNAPDDFLHIIPSTIKHLDYRVSLAQLRYLARFPVPSFKPRFIALQDFEAILENLIPPTVETIQINSIDKNRLDEHLDTLESRDLLSYLKNKTLRFVVIFSTEGLYERVEGRERDQLLARFSSLGIEVDVDDLERNHRAKMY